MDSIGEYLEDKLKDQYTFEDTTDVAIKFSIQPPGQSSIDIDLILSPFFSDHHDYLQALKQVQPPKMRHKMYGIKIHQYGCLTYHTGSLFHQMCIGFL